MSVKVDLDRLADVVGDFAFAYLISVGDDYRAHTVFVEPVFRDGRLDVGTVGRHTRENTERHGDVTVVWPPREAGGYSLIVDGRARPSNETLTIEPTRAVLHRKATAESASTSPDCRHDCVPLDDKSPGAVRTTRVIADLRVADIEAANSFYVDFLGLRTEEFNLGWVARYTSPDTGANVQLVTRDATAPEDPVVSVCVDDVGAAYADAQQRGYEIVHPLTTEAWGVQRFFVRAPDGNVLNIVDHRD